MIRKGEGYENQTAHPDQQLAQRALGMFKSRPPALVELLINKARICYLRLAWLSGYEIDGERRVAYAAGMSSPGSRREHRRGQYRVLETRARVEDNGHIVASQPACVTQQAYGTDGGRSFGADEQALELGAQPLVGEQRTVGDSHSRAFVAYSASSTKKSPRALGR